MDTKFNIQSLVDLGDTLAVNLVKNVNLYGIGDYGLTIVSSIEVQHLLTNAMCKDPEK